MYIYKAGVVGAGLMGAEIAQTITYAGLPVVLKDVNQELVDRGLAAIRKIYQGRVDKGKMTAEEMHAKLALVSPAVDYAAFKDVDLVIEAVPEKIDLKKKVFVELDKALPESAILASNTSALSISELAGATRRPSKVVGLHFFFPAHVMKLVEVVPGLDTSQETVDDAVGFAESLRKIPIRVEECAGFLVNRLLMPYLNEAAACLQEGSASLQEIDQAMVAFGFPMGPFTLIDNLGLDVCAEVAETLTRSYGPRMKPAELWEKLYEAGRFGVKKGAGFYLYGERGKDRDEQLSGFIEEIQRGTQKRATRFSSLRLLIPMINEAALCIQERVSTPQEIDLATVAGIAFPQDKGGLLRYADETGLDTILNELDKLYREHGLRFWPAPYLRRLAGAGFVGAKAKRGFLQYT